MHATVRRLVSWCVFWDERYLCRTVSLNIERCTVSTRSFSASANREDGTAAPADVKKLDAAASIDGYLKSIHLKHKIRNDFAMKHEYNRLRRMSRGLARVQPIAEPSSLSSRTREKAESRFSPQNSLDPETILTKLETADREGKALPIMDLTKYASACAQHGRVEGVELCQKIMAEHDEEEFEKQMKLQHYLGNALWMAGRFRDSVDVFKTAFCDYPLGRRKIINLFRFSIYRTVNAYPCPEQLDSLNAFVDYAAEFKLPQVMASTLSRNPMRQAQTAKLAAGASARHGCFLSPSWGSRGLVRTRLPAASTPQRHSIRAMSVTVTPAVLSFLDDLAEIVEKMRVFRSSLTLPASNADTADDNAHSFLVEEVIAALMQGRYEHVRHELARLCDAAVDLSPRQRLQLASACLPVLMERRSRLKVLSATLAAPGELSDSAQYALHACLDADRGIVLDVTGGLSCLLQHAVPVQSQSALKSALTPLGGLLLMETHGKDTMWKFLSVLDVMVSAVQHLIKEFDAESVELRELISKPALIRDLDQVASLVNAHAFEPDVQFAVGLHSDYDAADWTYYADEYDGPCRLLVHMQWVYAVVHATDVHGGAIGQLMDIVMENLRAKSKDFVSLTEGKIANVVDRLGCGVVIPRKSEKLVRFSGLVTGEYEKKNPDVIVFEVAFTHERLTHLFIESANLLGPTTQFQYCLAMKVAYYPPGKTGPFWASLFVFRKVANPRTKPPTDAGSCKPAHEGVPVGRGKTKYYLVSGEEVYDRNVEEMTAKDILRVFDMHLIFQHRADEKNIKDAVEFSLDIRYPDGSSRVFAFPLGELFLELRGLWIRYYRERHEQDAE